MPGTTSFFDVTSTATSTVTAEAGSATASAVIVLTGRPRPVAPFPTGTVDRAFAPRPDLDELLAARRATDPRFDDGRGADTLIAPGRARRSPRRLRGVAGRIAGRGGGRGRRSHPTGN